MTDDSLRYQKYAEGAKDVSDRLDEIEARERKATCGPWTVTRCLDNGFPIDVRAPSPYDCAKLFDVRGFGYFSGKGHGALGLSAVDAGDCMNANADFIAHAREDIPWLLSELKTAREMIAALKEGLKPFADELTRQDEAYRKRGGKPDAFPDTPALALLLAFLRSKEQT